MKGISKLLVIAIIFSFALATTAEAGKRIKPGAKMRTQTGELIKVYKYGVTVQNVDCDKAQVSSGDCLLFCQEVCETTSADDCYCGGETFPCSLALPECDDPVIKQ